MNLPTGSERDLDQAKLLLEEYCFDLSGFQAGELVAIWQERLEADPSWIRSAVLEALYQGRYKAFSVEQILQGWKRRGFPVRHFNSEFERVVFGPIDPTISKYAPMTTSSPSALMAPPAPPPSQSEPPTTPKPPSSPDTLLPDETSSRSNDWRPPATPPANPASPADGGAAASASPQPPSEPPGTDPPPTIDAFLMPEPVDSTSVFNQPEPIRKFVPASETSEFYQRLQSVAKHSQ